MKTPTSIEVIQLSRDCIVINDKYVIRSINGVDWLPEAELTHKEWEALQKFIKNKFPKRK